MTPPECVFHIVVSRTRRGAHVFAHPDLLPNHGWIAALTRIAFLNKCQLPAIINQGLNSTHHTFQTTLCLRIRATPANSVSSWTACPALAAPLKGMPRNLFNLAPAPTHHPLERPPNRRYCSLSPSLYCHGRCGLCQYRAVG